MTIIGLGLDHRLRDLRRSGSITYNGWHDAGLTRVDPVTANLSALAFQRAFEEAAENSTAIVFDLTDLDLEHARQNGPRGFVSRNYTIAELTLICKTSRWLAKSTFLCDGQEVQFDAERFVASSP